MTDFLVECQRWSDSASTRPTGGPLFPETQAINMTICHS